MFTINYCDHRGIICKYTFLDIDALERFKIEYKKQIKKAKELLENVKGTSKK